METIITPQQVIDLAFSPNELLTPSIITEADITEAEHCYIRPILGEELWRMLVDGDYKELTIEYAGPAIAAWTRYVVQPLLEQRCSACLTDDKRSIYDSTTAGNNRQRGVMRTLRRKASILSQRLTDYLNRNTDMYPEYVPANNPLNRCSINGDIIQIR